MGFGDVELDDVADGLAADPNPQGFGSQAGAVAFGAARVSAVAAEEHAHVDFVVLLFDSAEIVLDGRVQDDDFFGLQFADGDGEADLPLEVAAEFREIPGVLRLGPGIDGALLDGERAIGDDEVEVVVDSVAEALAAFAGALRVVEAEEPGLRFVELLAALLAFEAQVEAEDLVAAGGLEEGFAGFAVADF